MTAAAILAPEGLGLTASERSFFRDAQPWGFILFARNVSTPNQLCALTSELRSSVGWEAPILIDQEGGRVQRMRGPVWREFLPALDQVSLAGTHAARSMWLRARLIAAELHDVGIDVNCAPLADVARNDTHAVLRNRLYGKTPSQVAENARATANGFLAGGVLPVLKHLPGYGRATVDSHHDLPRVTVDRNELEAIDFEAFRPLSNLPLGMTAHILLEAVDNAPATLSAGVIDLIRENIGFNGLLMTDDISMEALPGGLRHRTRKALSAGCDLVLHCNGRMPEMIDVITEAGTLGDFAKARADAALAHRSTPQPLDIAAAEDELASLLTGQAYDAGSAETGE